MSLFDQLIPFQGTRSPRRTNENSEERFATPLHELKESAEAFGLELFVPGVSRDAVEIHVDQGELVITARRGWKQPEGWTEVFRESSRFDYRLRLDLNDAVNVDKINAELEHGVLRVTLPKTESVKPRKIEIG